MSKLSIPVALDAHGNPVPIEEAVRYKTDYYRCPECGEIVNPRKGSVRTHFYAHKKGVLEDTDCSLSSQADIDQMVDELRTSDVEKEERERQIRLYLQEVSESRVGLFGILPSLDWDDIEPSADVDQLLSQLSIWVSGVDRPPTPSSFHPSEPEVFLDLDPSADKFSVQIDDASHLETLQGQWTANGVAAGDVFIGDQTRARRHTGTRQVKDGEWVYAVTDTAPDSLPDRATTYTLDSFTVIGFPVAEETRDLLDQYTDGATADRYGFDADIILPATATPTSEEPITGQSGESVLICVTPADEIDPVFEVVPVPRKDADVTEIEPTGPGNPRYYRTTFPDEGSQRLSIHQRNSSRHRLVHLHAESDSTTPEQDLSGPKPDQIGLQISLDDEEILLSPGGGQTTITIGSEINPVALPSHVSYIGPESLEIEYTAQFTQDAPQGPQIRRSTDSLAEDLAEIGYWATQGCEHVTFHFDGLGSVCLKFASAASPPAHASADQQPSGEGQPQ